MAMPVRRGAKCAAVGDEKPEAVADVHGMFLEHGAEIGGAEDDAGQLETV